MKYLIIAGILALLPGCKKCVNMYDTSSDQGKCWKECAQAAAASRYFTWNFESCINTACGYSHREECK